MKYLFVFLVFVISADLIAQKSSEEIDFFVTTENDSSFHIKPFEIAPRLEKTLFILNGKSVDESILNTINRKLISRVNASPTDSLLT